MLILPLIRAIGTEVLSIFIVDTPVSLFYDVPTDLNELDLIAKGGEMGKQLNDRAVTVILSNEIGYERIAMACSASFAQMFGCSPERIEDLKTVVAEAAINAMEHGNKGRADARVIVYMNCRDDAINVSVIDEGDGIKELPPNPNTERIIDELDPPTGFGVFLINQLADKVEYNQMTDEGHAVRMAINMR
jgi:serine/threonine-protein kinase RsbW